MAGGAASAPRYAYRGPHHKSGPNGFGTQLRELSGTRL